MKRKSDMTGGASGGGGTTTGKTKGNRGISGIPQGISSSARRAGRAPGDPGWPGEADCRPQEKDGHSSARSS